MRPSDDDGEGFSPSDLYTLPQAGPADPRAIAADLVAGDQLFAHLRHGDAVIMFLMRQAPKVKGGKAILGTMALPRFQGALGEVGTWLLAQATGGTLPDFIMVLDAGFWETATQHQRTALVCHELMHADHALDRDGEPRFTPDGLPIWGIREHDITEFNEVARRYGAWLPDIQDFVTAAASGGVHPA